MALKLLAVSPVENRRSVFLTHGNNIREQQAWAIPWENITQVQKVTKTQVGIVTCSTRTQSHSTQLDWAEQGWFYQQSSDHQTTWGHESGLSSTEEVQLTRWEQQENVALVKNWGKAQVWSSWTKKQMVGDGGPKWGWSGEWKSTEEHGALTDNFPGPIRWFAENFLNCCFRRFRTYFTHFHIHVFFNSL